MSSLDHTVTFNLPTTQELRSIKVHVTVGPDKGRVVPIDRSAFTVGSGPSADLRLSDPIVSREHVTLSPTERGVRVRDATSKNGTFIGVARVYDLVLTNSASIVVGGTTLFLELEAKSVAVSLSPRDHFGAAIGRTSVMRELFAKLEAVAAEELSVLLEGESGVGKDVLANAVHAASPRRDGPFIIADCSAIPEGVIESELFGHTRGAFTGADRDRAGLFEQASGGTVFLDEIGELPLAMQPKLLRVLEAREVRPVGGSVARPVDVRIVAATNKNLSEAARIGEFRSDLFYRIAVVSVYVPPLRERKADILPIARAMLRKSKRDPMADFSPGFGAMMNGYDWPGNVRELRNAVERYAALGETTDVLNKDMNQVVGDRPEVFDLPYNEARRVMLDRFDAIYVERVLASANGVVARAAEKAGIGRASLYRMLERLREGGENEG